MAARTRTRGKSAKRRSSGPADRRNDGRGALLDRSLSALGVDWRGTALETRLERLHDELGRRGLCLRPYLWLSTDFFTPDGATGFAVPFYLADRRLIRLEREQMHAVVDIQLKRFNDRLGRRQMHADVTPAARELLIERGWDPQYGARPLKRAIQKELQDELAKRLLAGDFGVGDTIAVDANNGALSFARKALN